MEATLLKNDDEKKTINLEDKKQLKNSTQTPTNTKTQNQNHNQHSNNSHKVISYGITKKKKKVKTVLFKNKFQIVLIFVLLMGSLISFSINSNLPRKKIPPVNKFESINPVVSQSDFTNYSIVVSNSIKKTLNLSDRCTVVSESMHKNGTKTYVQGYFYIDSYKQIYFDTIIQGDIVTSIIINGVEYKAK